MATAATTEPVFNSAFGRALRGKHPLWKDAIGVERTGVLLGAPGRQPDILLAPSGSSPVAIEAEFAPAATVEADAASRLGANLEGDGGRIENAIALRIPSELRTVRQNEIEEAIGRAAFAYCVLSETKTGGRRRWPESGWLHGGVDDVANCLESVSLSESLISRTTDVLEEGVTQAANILKTAEEPIHRSIAAHLHQAPGEQTNRMAVAIMANAAVFHTRIEGREGVPLLDDLKGPTGFYKIGVLDCWRWTMENVNYWPIFRIASDLLAKVPTIQANRMLNRLYGMAGKLADMGAASLNDLSGRMFQKLIADRKFLATFYTLPVSAALLAELAASRLRTDWGSADAVKGLRVADLACGTGTLIGALYHAVLARRRRAGSDDAEIHSAMMEESLYAFDIMPAATHLAASTLSNAHPAVLFGTTRIVTMPYGYDENRHPHIGSLELIVHEQATSLLSLGGERVAGRSGAETEEASRAVGVPHESMDVVIMNPPFTRPTNHETAEVPVPSFAGFSTSDEEQKAMSSRLRLMRGRLPHPAGHGNAGLASNFIDLAHAKLKPGGVLALVLPATFAQGESWEAARNLLAERYRDVTVVTIATDGPTDRAFSADTGMAEVLVVATRRDEEDEDGESTFQFVNLHRRPVHHLEAVELAKFMAGTDRRPGTGRIVFGREGRSGEIAVGGSYINAERFHCGCAGLAHHHLARFMLSLAEGELLAIRRNRAAGIPLTRLKNLGERGLLSRDLTGAPPRGPFKKIPLLPGQLPAYPALWTHDARRERSFMVEADCELRSREGSEEQAADVWQRFASRLHLTVNFQVNSQSLAACLTPEKTLGGTAWPNFILEDIEHEKAVLLWFNSTLGLMGYWWAGTRQQLGRTRVQITTIPSLLSIDARELDKRALRKADSLFERFRGVEFLPANESYHDPGRKALDEALLVELLGVPAELMDDFDLVRRQWCAEPSVHGGKKTRLRA